MWMPILIGLPLIALIWWVRNETAMRRYRSQIGLRRINASTLDADQTLGSGYEHCSD